MWSVADETRVELVGKTVVLDSYSSFFGRDVDLGVVMVVK